MMAKNLKRLADFVGRSDFADRVRLAATAAALKALEPGGNNEERANFGMSILRGDIPVHVIATATLAAIAEVSPDPAPGDIGKPMEIPDALIELAMRPGGDIADGVYAKLAMAHARKPEPGV
jgi:hypothetical protein